MKTLDLSLLITAVVTISAIVIAILVVSLPQNQNPVYEYVIHEPYQGADKEYGTVTIQNRTFHVENLDKMVDDKSRPVWLQMYGVNFSFPNGIEPQITPSGEILESFITFPDDSVPYRIAVGLGSSPSTPHYDYTTVLSTHKEPQAGFTIHNGTVQLLVSSNQISTENDQTVNKTEQVVPPCVSHIPHQYAIAGAPGDPLCPFMNFEGSAKILNASGFYGIYNHAYYPGTLNYVIEPGHNGTITYFISVNAVHNYGNISEYSNQINITNDVVLMHDAGMNNHPGVDVLVKPKSEMIASNGSTLVTITFSVSKDALPGTYWVTLPPGFCAGGQRIILTVTDCTK